MKGTTWLITGTGTDVGKTVFAAHFAAFLAQSLVPLRVFKPVASGSRSDARLLRQANRNRQSLHEINPWHFKDAIAPVIAARKAKKTVSLKSVLQHIRSCSADSQHRVVEGAGGLLSPVGENWDSRTLLEALRAIPLVVAPVQLGAVNQIRLTWEALSQDSRKKARVILMMPARNSLVCESTLECLGEYVPMERCVPFPRLGSPASLEQNLRLPAVRESLEKVAACI